MKNFFLTFVLTISILQLSAISFDGILITLEGDTIYCQIQFSDLDQYAHNGEILSTKKITALIDGAKRTYSADELTNYSVLIGKAWKTYWGVNTAGKKFRFMKREVDGKLSFYSGITYNSIHMRHLRYYVFVKSESSDKLYLEHGTASNSQKLTKFIAECPVAVGLIYSNTIDIGNPSDWKLVALKYNEEC